MASAQISETIRPAYIWTGSEWVQIGDGGSGTGGGGSVVGGTNIDVNYNEELNTYTVSASGGFTNVDSIQYPDYIAFNNNPSLTSASPGTIFWDGGEGTLDLILNENIDIALGQEIIVKCYNGEETALNKGEVVMVSGAQGQRPRIIRAYNTSDAGSARTFGIVAENINSGEEGFVVTQGIVKGIDTDSFNPGDPLYLSATPGQFQTEKPQAPNHYVWVGVVLSKNQSSGRIYVKPQNGYELDEIHDVRITSIAEGDIIVWNSASSLWLNEPIQNYLNTASAAAAAYTDQEISNLIAGAPEALDTLNELAAALNDDENFASTVINTITSASAFSLSEASEYTDGAIDQLFVHEDHVKVEVAYNEESNKIIITGEGVPTTSYGTASPSFVGEEEEIFYQINEEITKVVNRYVYIDGGWRLFSEESFTWESLGLQTWQWLLDNAELDGWEFLVSGQSSIGPVDFNTRFVPNIIADIRYLQKNEFGEALVSGSSVVLNYLSSGSPTLNAGIKVNRGNENPVELIWNEEKNYWEFTEDGENYKKLGSGAVLYQSSQPDVSDLEVGTLWIDEDQSVGSGLDIQTFLSWTKTLSASASVFSGTDDNFAVLKYRINLEQVYLNGTLLVRDIDYTASNGTSITLTEAAVENDVITIHAFESFLVSETYNKDQIDSTFLTQGSASATYLTQESASNIYLTEISASVSYVPRNETELVKYGPTEPTSPEEGTIWIDSTNVIKPITKVYNGSTWIIASGASEAAIHPFFLAGI